ncbi:glycosyltransferase [Conexibacter woesei]|uniref:glycosyltransferase n=1 Tax=Conexibacter woesei TaxID=191495 RepID=UPI00040BF386|nr:glycosyltransferase [Conexibacter woesei]
MDAPSPATAQRALLGLLVPTYDRAPLLERLLEALEREIGDRDDIIVQVADNASPDATPEILAAASVRLPWLRVHRQPENIGPFANGHWLMEHAPDAEYLWCFGDDDVPLPGAIERTAALLREHRPAWLFHPYLSAAADGVVTHWTPVTGAAQVHPDPGALWRDQHQYLTFLSASIVRADALRDAHAATTAENAYLPLLWFFRAGLQGPCVVAGEHGVLGCTDIGWADVAHEYLTLHFTKLYDDVLHLGLTEAEFGESLNGLYRDGLGLSQWRRVPIERLAEVVRRFPQCRELRVILWQLARDQQRPDVLNDLDAGLRRLGLDVEARTLHAAGVARFEAGDAIGAARLIETATAVAPSLPGVWNDLGVVYHALEAFPRAAECLELALFVDPADDGARANRDALVAPA